MRNSTGTRVGAASCLVAAIATCALCGCGSGSGGGVGPTGTAGKQSAKASANAQGLAGMVSGVAAPGATTSSVQVKFQLKERPEVAQPLDVDVVIVPVYGNLERISGKFAGDDGLEMVSGQDIEAIEKPVEGTPIHRTVQVLPKRPGVFTLTAVLIVDSEGQSSGLSFSTPVIAGDSPSPPTSAGTASPQGSAATQ
jgi:hypothetical protein